MDFSKFIFNVVETDLEVATLEGTELTGLKAIYKEDELDPKKWLGYHTKEYKLVTNEEVIEAVTEILGDLDAVIKNISDKTSFCNDKRMYLSLLIDHGFDLGNDPFNLLLQIYNSYDGSMSWGIDFGSYRQICSNGAYAFKEIAKYKKKHSLGFNKDYMRHQIMEAMSKFDELLPLYNRLKAVTVGREEIDKLFDNAVRRNMLAKKERESLDYLTEGDRVNGYVFFNIMTAYLTHSNIQFERSRRMNKATMNFLHNKI